MHCNTVRWLTDRSEQLGNYDDENLSLLMNFSSTTLLMNSFSDKPIGWPASPRTKNYVFQRMMLHFGAWNLRQDQLLCFHPKQIAEYENCLWKQEKLQKQEKWG